MQNANFITRAIAVAQKMDKYFLNALFSHCKCLLAICLIAASGGVVINGVHPHRDAGVHLHGAPTIDHLRRFFPYSMKRSGSFLRRFFHLWPIHTLQQWQLFDRSNGKETDW